MDKVDKVDNLLKVRLLDVTLLAKGPRVEEIVRSENYFIGALKVCLTVTYI